MVRAMRSGVSLTVTAAGSLVVGILLAGAAVGIARYSYDMSLAALAASPELVASLPDFVQHNLPSAVADGSHHMSHAHDHSSHAHGHVHALDGNAAWFAAGAIVIKELLFRASTCILRFWAHRAAYKIAKEERSPVLFAKCVEASCGALTLQRLSPSLRRVHVDGRPRGHRWLNVGRAAARSVRSSTHSRR